MRALEEVLHARAIEVASKLLQVLRRILHTHKVTPVSVVVLLRTTKRRLIPLEESLLTRVREILTVRLPHRMEPTPLDNPCISPSTVVNK